jgi:hypothetical protein
MPRLRISSIRRFELILAAILSVCAPSLLAQHTTEAALKAAFIYNFAKFTEWPQVVLPAATPFVMCVLGDSAVGDALERAVRNRDHAGHGIQVMRVDAGGPLTSCHILYVTGVTASQATSILISLHGAAVLTISDLGEFVRLGGMTQFFVEEGTMRFCINADSATGPRLQFSSRLLALARCPR